MGLKMTVTIYADNRQGLTETLTDIRRQVGHGFIYDSQMEDGVGYNFRVTDTPPLVLDPEGGLVLDPDREKVT